MCVVKFPGDASERVARSLHEVGPGTAGQLAERLGLTAAAVRRSLTALVDAGLAQAGERAPFGPAPASRRGRPSHVYSLTAAGRSACAQGSDDLALEALNFVARTQGKQAVRAFAAERTRAIVDVPDEHDPVDAVSAVADSLRRAGYAAEVAGVAGHTVQLCQHACPMADAATAFPEICEAETEVLSQVLGVHVTRLATIAHGDGVCTIAVPVPTSERSNR